MGGRLIHLLKMGFSRNCAVLMKSEIVQFRIDKCNANHSILHPSIDFNCKNNYFRRNHFVGFCSLQKILPKSSYQCGEFNCNKILHCEILRTEWMTTILLVFYCEYHVTLILVGFLIEINVMSFNSWYKIFSFLVKYRAPSRLRSIWWLIFPSNN